MSGVARPMPNHRRILVIKLSALGDLVMAFAPMAAIRAHHPNAELTLLTTRPFAALMQLCPWFDRVAIDERPRFWDLAGRRRLRSDLSDFDFVYDLQTSGRSSRHHRLAGRPPWSGIVRGASHPDANPNRNALHTRVRQAGQLRQAGIESVPDADLSWLATQAGPAIPRPYAILVPGAAPHRPRKRWAAERFGLVAAFLAEQGVTTVIVGSAEDHSLAERIRRVSPATIDLTGRTSLPELGGVCARATLAIGNDTGPMHMAAAMGAHSLTLFSSDSDPALTAPTGRTPDHAAILRADDLAALSAETVVAAVAALARQAGLNLPLSPSDRPALSASLVPQACEGGQGSP